MKKTHAVEPSGNVEKILKLINLVSPEVELPDADKLFNHYYDKKVEHLKNENPDGKSEAEIYSEVDDHYRYNITAETVSDVMKKIHSLNINPKVLLLEIVSLVSDIEQREYEHYSAYDLFNCYKQFWGARIKVRYIAELPQILSGNGRGLFENRLYSLFTSFNVTLSSEPSITSDGYFTFQTDFVAKVFEGIKADRLKICLYCERIFWATRIDKLGCSTKCGQNIRTKKRRKKIKTRFPSRIMSKEEKEKAYDKELDDFFKNNSKIYKF